MGREQVRELAGRLHEAQRRATERILQVATFENLSDESLEGYAVQDLLRMWVWHFWSHHRDLIRARGCIEGDNPHVHVPHFVRQAHEEFGRFVGELVCLTDEQLDLKPPDGERSVREVVEHVLDSLTNYLSPQVARACAAHTSARDGEPDQD